MARKTFLRVILALMATLSILYGQMGVIILKGLMSPLSLVIGVWNVKATYRKSWPANLSLVSNLTFDHHFDSRIPKIEAVTYNPNQIAPIIGSEAHEDKTWQFYS